MNQILNKFSTIENTIENTLVLIWDKFKLKNAKIATIVSIVIGASWVILSELLKIPQIQESVSPFILSLLIKFVNIIGFLVTVLIGSRTSKDKYAIELMKKNDSIKDIETKSTINKDLNENNNNINSIASYVLEQENDFKPELKEDFKIVINKSLENLPKKNNNKKRFKNKNKSTENKS